MTQSIGRFKRLATRPSALRRAMNMWPPLLFAGVKIEHIGPDFQSVHVRLAKNPLTSNYFGTQYGGSMFSMTDPFWTIMIARNLGPEYTVWDKRGEIEFIAPGRTAVSSKLVLTTEVLDELKAAAGGGEKVLRWFSSDVLDRHGVTIAIVRKQVYVRRKPRPAE